MTREPCEFRLLLLVLLRLKWDSFSCDDSFPSRRTGGVAVGSMGNMMLGPGGAMAVGAAAGVLSVIGYSYIQVR